jgi:hypothetical protein
MTAKYDYLHRLRRYEDAATGISEEFLSGGLGPGQAFGILSRPLTECRSPGWVICSALGKERSFLRRLEALLARRLASTGFPVVRVRGGCEDPQGPTRELSLAARRAEATDAIAALRSETGPTDIGVAGVLGGGTAAALVAEELDLPFLALVAPVVRGRQFLRDALRMQSLSALVGDGTAGGVVPGRKASEELEEQGWTTIRGFRLTRDDRDELESVDLLDRMRRFRGASLVLDITPTGDPHPSAAKLRDHLAGLGARATLRVLEDPLVVPFGESYLRDVSALRRDTRLELDRKLADACVEWLLQALGRDAPA